MATILVADDNEDMQLVLQLAVERMGHAVILAGDGTAALSVCLNGHVDVALLDVTMPGLEGPEVVAKVRRHPERHRLPILLVSAMSGYDDIDRGLRAGADDYITKPFNTFELTRRVERMVWLSEQLDEPDERGRMRKGAMAALSKLIPRQHD
jgi:DNA-binding response OmpR family regulator